MVPLKRVAVIGGGFFGTLAVIQLLRQGAASVRIDWFERNESMRGLGVAYATQDSVHLLNVPAIRMGAFPDDITGFHRWLEAGSHAVAQDDFVPRMLYGEYVRSHSTEQVKRRTGEINAIDRLGDAWALTMGTERLEYDAVILACGHLDPARRPFNAPVHANIVESPWAKREDSPYPHGLKASDTVAIIGTGLTMADTVMTLERTGFKGRIVALSRHGLLPARHASPATPYAGWTGWPKSAPKTALGLLREFRARAKTEEWRGLIDSLRGMTPALWAQLPEKEKKRFTRHLLTFWNVHRHRMAPQIHDTLSRLSAEGRLEIHAARVKSVACADQSVTIACSDRTIDARCVIFCLGPTLDIRRSNHALLNDVLDKGYAKPGPINMGVAKASLAPGLFAGAGLFTGDFLESTAVPELRQHALEAARDTLAYLNQ